MLTQQKGQQAEQKALDYLSKHGLKLVERNFRCRLGEIDLIMHDKNHLVFVEVRSRSNTQFGGGLASVTFTKRQKILKTTSFYLIQNSISDRFAIRFDVVSIDGKTGQITWIKDAFQCNN